MSQPASPDSPESCAVRLGSRPGAWAPGREHSLLHVTGRWEELVVRQVRLPRAIVAYLVLRPASFAQTVPYQLSTSQLIGVSSALTVAYFYARFWDEARKTPKLSMSLGDAATIRELGGHPPEPVPAGRAPQQPDGDDDGEEGQSGESHA